jgi:hypothetical protein
MKRIAMLVLALGMALSGVAVAEVASVEEATSKHMVAQAMLTAHFIDAALQAGYSADEINWILRKVAAQSVISEFWISGENGEIEYTNNPGTGFAFPTDVNAGTQAAPFAALFSGLTAVVVQDAQPRQIDAAIYKYVAVSGVDKARIVQVGVNAAELGYDY